VPADVQRGVGGLEPMTRMRWRSFAARRWRARVRDNRSVRRLSLITAAVALAVVVLGLGWALGRAGGDDRPDLGPSIVVPAAGGATATPDVSERRARQRREREDRARDRARDRDDARRGTADPDTSSSRSGSQGGGDGRPGDGSASPVSPPAALPAGDDDDDAGEAEDDGDD
jgi:hypothetical protein